MVSTWFTTRLDHRAIEADDMKYIDIDIAKRIIDSGMSQKQMLSMLAQTPAADVTEVVHGYWTEFDPEGKPYYTGRRNKNSTPHYVCSSCGSWKERESKFCPDCGAIMDNEWE